MNPLLMCNQTVGSGLNNTGGRTLKEDSPFYTMRTTIEVYDIQIKRSGTLMDFGEDPDFFDIISNEETGFVHHVDMNKTGDIATLKRTVRIPATITNDDGDLIKFHHSNKRERYICGIIESGPYGKEFDVANKDTPNEVAYTVGKDQAVIKPFFYYLKIPRHGDRALLILERTDNEGIFPLMQLLLKTFLNDHYGIEKGYTIEKNNIILNTYLEELNEGRYKSLTLTALQPSSDASDRYFGGLESKDFTMELKIKFKNNLGDAKEREIRNLINNGTTLFELQDFNSIFEGSTRKVVSTVGSGSASKTRTLYLNTEQQSLIHPYYDIEVEANEHNFSSYPSIKGVVKAFVTEHREFSNFN